MSDEHPGHDRPGWDGWSSPRTDAWMPPLPGPETGPDRPRPRRPARPIAVAATLVLAGAAVGAGVGHVTWSTSSAAHGTGLGTGGTTQNQSPGGSGGFGGQDPFGIGGGSGDSPGGSSGDSSGGSGGGETGGGAQTGTSVAASKISPAIVDVNSTFGYQSSEGAGTGIVLTGSGEVLTNNHVINGATKITATDVGNGKTYSATVVGYDATHDVAVLQLRGASGLTTAPIGNSAAVAVGAAVVAVGNAGGAGGTPSVAGGSVTALNQSITAGDDSDGTSEQLSGLLATDADVEPGDSGGPLATSDGHVIGMDTAASEGYSFQGSGASQGFAIPINQALVMARQIEAGHGSSTVHVGSTAFLGVMITSRSGQGGFYGGGAGAEGATVGQVVSGGSADQAGIEAGDVITDVGGQAVDSPTRLAALLVGHHPGDRISVGWTDAYGQNHTATVTLQAGPPA